MNAPTKTKLESKPAASLVITRIIDAPRKLVFDAITKPEHMQQWWGPHGYTTPFCEIDLRKGGAWKLCMRSSGVPDHWISGTILDVVEPERFVFKTFGFQDDHGNFRLESDTTLLLEDFQGKTKLTLQADVIRYAPELQPAIDGMAEGWGQSLDRLHDFVLGIGNTI